MSQTDPNVAQVLTAYVSAKLGEMLKTMVTSEKVSPDLFCKSPVGTTLFVLTRRFGKRSFVYFPSPITTDEPPLSL